MYVMSSHNCKCVDKHAIEKFNIPSIILMENAANSVFYKVKDFAQKYVILIGCGNNGGDGLAIGRKLLEIGKDVEFIIINPKDKYSTDCSINLEIVKHLTHKIRYIKSLDQIEEFNLAINAYDVIIDSIFGVGINRELNIFYKRIIECINLSNAKVISIDVPSGLDCDTGKPLGAAVKAHITYSFEVMKIGFLKYSALEYLGKIEIVHIGIPSEVKKYYSENIYIIHDSEYKDKIIKRNSYGHKGDYGRAVLFAGSSGFTGAAYISTQSCVRTGTGLTTLVTPKECQEILSSKLVEAMTVSFDDENKIIDLLNNADVIAFGPGIQNEKQYEDKLLWIINNSKANLVIDAEGINILSRRADILKNIRARAILTPHHGEMARLTGKSIEYIEDNRIEIAKKVARDNECIVLLKGYNTVITDGQDVFINNRGNSKMATGGMGDCLTGIITSLLAQGHNLMDSTILGAYIHGKAAEEEGIDKYSVLASDVINRIPKIMNDLIIN